MPKIDMGPDPDAHVPARLRGVKLEKKRARYRDRDSFGVFLLVFMLAVVTAAGIAFCLGY